MMFSNPEWNHFFNWYFFSHASTFFSRPEGLFKLRQHKTSIKHPDLVSIWSKRPWI